MMRLLLPLLLAAGTALALGVYAPLGTTPQANATIAPHLYIWYFDGSGYIQTPYMSVFDNHSFTVELSTYLTTTQTNLYASDQPLFSEGDAQSTDEYLILLVRGGYPYFAFYADDLQASSTVETYRWLYFDFVWNSTTKFRAIYLNATAIASGYSSGYLVVTSGSASGNGAQIARYALEGNLQQSYIDSVRIYNRVLSQSEMSTEYASKVVPSSGLVAFLDATFYNGQQYIDLSGNGYNGVPVGGTYRVPATAAGEGVWLWYVPGLYSDGYVHLRFFPQSSWLVLANGSLIPMSAWKSAYCPSAVVDQAGMVEDCPTPPSAAQLITGLAYDYNQAPHFVSVGGNWYQIVVSFYMPSAPSSQYFYVPQGYALVVAEQNGTIYYAGSQAPAVQGYTYFVVYPQPLSLSYLTSASPGCQPGQIMLGYAGFYEADLAVCTSYVSPTSSFAVYTTWLNATLLRVEVAYYNYTTSARKPVAVFASAYCYGNLAQPAASGAGVDVVYLNAAGCNNGVLVELSANTTATPSFDIYVPPASQPIVSPGASAMGYTAFFAMAAVLIGMAVAYISEYGGRNSALAIGVFIAALVYVGGPAFGLPQAISQAAAALIVIVSVLAWAYARR